MASGFSHTSARASTVNLTVSLSILKDKLLTSILDADIADGALRRKGSVSDEMIFSIFSFLQKLLTRPISFASLALKFLPLVNKSKALLEPIFKITYGLIVAGIKPSFTSVRASFMFSVQIAISQTEIIPIPPPKALPSTFAIRGLGN